MRELTLFLLLSLPLVASQTCSQWSEARDVNTLNSLPQAGVTTLEQCQSRCLSQSSGCPNGFDWIYVNAQGNRCFISVTSTTKSASGYSHYTCTSNPLTTTQAANIVTTAEPKPTGPTVVWTETKDTNTNNGVLKTMYPTLQTCQAACYQQKDTNCKYGIDFNPNVPSGSGCYFSTTATLNVGAFPGTSHYNYEVKKNTVCSLSEEKNKNSPGGVLETSASTIQLCEEKCKERENCKYGFDWNPSVPAGSQCYISVSDQRSDFPGVSHYTVVCQTACEWVETKDKNSPQGRLMGNYNSRLDCQNACFAASDTEKCKYGYDYQEGAQNGFKCYFSVSKTLTDFPGVNHWNPRCEDTGTKCTFKEMDNTNSPNGLVKNNLNTLDECKLGCQTERKTNCKYGFDYVESAAIGRRCWFSTTETTRTANGVKHYTISCSTGGGDTTGVTGIPNVCLWAEVQGQNTQNGKQQSSANTLEECQKACISAKDTDCKFGLDYNSGALSGSRCWFSTTSTLRAQSGVNHYNYDCSLASCTWNVEQNKNTRGGVSQNFNTLSECRTGCIAAKKTTCKNGLDWQAQGTPNFKCFFTTNPQLYDSPGVDHHTLTCSGETGGTGGTGMTTNFGNTLPAGISFEKTPDKNSPGGVVQAAATTLQACKEICAADIVVKCKYGFDFNPTASEAQRCWLSTNNLLATAAGITHYNPIKVETCTWIKSANSNTAGGILQSGLDTLEKCQSKCQELKATTCNKGLDFNTGNKQCFFSTSTDIRSGASGIDHYDCQGSGPTTLPQTTQKTTQPTTTAPGANLCTWVAEANMNSPGGEQKSYDSLDECRNFCALLVKGSPKPCPLGVDFDPSRPSGAKCFWSKIATTVAATGVTHYKCT